MFIVLDVLFGVIDTGIRRFGGKCIITGDLFCLVSSEVLIV